MNIHKKEDLEKVEALKFAKENNLWIEDFYTLGTQKLEGGHEHILTLDEKNSIVYKSNNLLNSKNSISNLFKSVEIHNLLFPFTAYEFVGFTGIDNGENRVPYIEVIFKQKYIPETTKAQEDEIKSYMESLGFEQRTPESYYNGEFLVYDLYPRNVLKDSNRTIYVVDAEFLKIDETKIELKKMD